RRDLRRRLLARPARGLRGRLQPRPAHLRHRPELLGAERADVPARYPRGGLRRGGPQGDRARRGHARRRRAPARPRRGRPGTVRGPAGRRGHGRRRATGRGGGAVTDAARPGIGIENLPLRENLRGGSAYGAPQLDGPVQLNTNENPHPPSRALVTALAAAGADAATDVHRCPDRDAAALRGELASFLARETGVGLDADSVSAANVANDIRQQLLQASGGPRRSAVGFVPSDAMHPLLAAGTDTRGIPVDRGADLALDVD